MRKGVKKCTEREIEYRFKLEDDAVMERVGLIEVA